MFIAIDIGNTDTVLGVYEGGKIKFTWRLMSLPQQTEDDLIMRIETLLKESDILTDSIKGVGISSVVPILTERYTAISQKYLGKKPLIVSASLDTGINLHYDDPGSLGSDRICSAVAGYSKYGGPLIIIDFGTATTFNIISSGGDFLGGVIGPGIGTSAISLHQRTAKLPKVVLQLPDKIISTNTEKSMQVGILLGAVDAMSGMLDRIQKELRSIEEKKPTIIATGGYSEFMSQHSALIHHIEPNLVLDGIFLIYNRTVGKNPNKS